MDITTDKLSIKNLLFTKAIPNYIIPVAVNGHKVFACTDCGDKFMFETSFHDHINRKSAKISYMCRHCNNQRIFYNRCNLLSHIRSHAFKTATINVSDLKVEPLPLSFFKTKPTVTEPPTSTSKQPVSSESTRKTSFSTITCYECKCNITITGIAYKDRASHFMQYTNEVYACPVCLFALPSICALKVHLRLHSRCPPYYCPECGIHLANKNVQYPYNHDCEGFKMMRATARLNCSVPDCSLFHPNDYKEHMKKYHLKTVYKCPVCVVACFNESTMEKHLKCHKTTAKALLFYQCDVCPGRYVLQNPKLNDNHLKSHINTTIYPCWACGSAFKDVPSLLQHFIKKHNKSDAMSTAINAILKDNQKDGSAKPRSVYRVVKRCEQCKRSFTYKCRYEEIPILPIECPFNCSTSSMSSRVTPEKDASETNDDRITCHLCQDKISQDWELIKTHYAEFHKAHKCLDVEILLKRIDVKKYLSKNKVSTSNTKTLQKVSKKNKNKKLNKSYRSEFIKSSTSTATGNQSFIASNEGDYACNMCSNRYDTKSDLENHMVFHRDPCMAYQCLECGQSFVVKPSFSKHLLLEHDIKDTDEYINTKRQCYNENAVMSNKNSAEIEIPDEDS